MGELERARVDLGQSVVWEETRLVVAHRLAGHGLRRYDRWALSQIATFLAGRAPEPDGHGRRGPAALPLSWQAEDPAVRLEDSLKP
jgi:hypothetical protein